MIGDIDDEIAWENHFNCKKRNFHNFSLININMVCVCNL